MSAASSSLLYHINILLPKFVVIVYFVFLCPNKYNTAVVVGNCTYVFVVLSFNVMSSLKFDNCNAV